MERAGHAVAWAVRRHLGDAYGKRVTVVCGKGNNGGDGLIAARVLRGWGIRVDVFELADGVAAPALDRALGRADVLVDAMFGTGFRGALEGDAALVARRSAEVPTIAVDIPSGVDGLTGAVHGDAVTADRDRDVRGPQDRAVLRAGPEPRGIGDRRRPRHRRRRRGDGCRRARRRAGVVVAPPGRTRTSGAPGCWSSAVREA